MKWTGEKLKNARLQKGLTQTQLGNMLGYSAMAVSHFENAKRSIPARVEADLDRLLDFHAPKPRYHTVHSPSNLHRRERFNALVSDFKKNGFTEQQASFLINLMDGFVPLY